jgi:hypothetical protein
MNLLKEEDELRRSKEGQELYKKYGYDEGTLQIRKILFTKHKLDIKTGLKILKHALFILDIKDSTSSANYVAGSFAAVPATQLNVGEILPETVQVGRLVDAKVIQERFSDLLEDNKTTYVVIALSAT